MATLTIADLDNGKRDLQTVDEVANSRAATATTRFGQQTTTLYESIRRINATGDEILSNLGFRVPVPYASGLSVIDSRFTVTGPDGKVYAPLSAPFTTGAWDPTQWYVLQNDLNDHKLLVFETMLEAEAAAATLPDNQRLSAGGGEYEVQTGALVYIKPSASVGEVESIAELVGLPIPLGACTIFVRGYYAASDGGGGLFVWDATSSTPSNTVTVFSPDSLPATGRWVRHVEGPITSKMAGMVGSGDESAKASALFNAAAATNKTAYVESGQYSVNGLTANCSLDMALGAKFVYNGPDNGVLLTVATSNYSHGDIRVDGGGKNCTTLNITGNDNQIFFVKSENIVGTNAGGFSVCGVSVPGANNNIKHMTFRNLVNVSHPNPSFPQSIVLQGANNKIGIISLYNCRAGLVLSTDVLSTVDAIYANGLEDNGIYQLTGHLVLGELRYYGNEEPVVFEGKADVGKITMIGQCLGIGFQDCGDVNIDSIHLEKDAAGKSPLFIFRSRPMVNGNGRISIGRITGQFKGTTLFLLNSGTTEYLSIKSMDVKFLYDASIATTLTSWANFTTVKGFELTNINIEVVDLNNSLVGGMVFSMSAPPSVQKMSFVHSLDVQIYSSDGITDSAAGFRGINFAQQKIETRGVVWQTNIGPYLIGNRVGSAGDDSSNGPPTAGSWERGKRLINGFPAAGGAEGWVCVLAGTPGNWKTFGSIAA